jgi:hypothetical protein
VSTDDRTDEPTAGPPAARPSCVTHYRIQVRGRLGARWATWFDGLRLCDQADGTTVMAGPVVDQAALHGLLQKLRDLGLPLVSLAQIAPDDADAPRSGPHGPSPSPSPDTHGATP